MTTPLTRQYATTDLLKLVIQGHTIEPQTRIVPKPSTDASVQSVAQPILFLDVPKADTSETLPKKVTGAIDWTSVTQQSKT